MDALKKALSAPSAYSVKKDRPDLWPDLVDRVNGACCPAHLDEILAGFDLRPFDLPSGWVDDLAEIVEKRREELAEEDIASILLDRFDFS